MAVAAVAGVQPEMALLPALAARAVMVMLLCILGEV
jgi:hypothetical protein